nr:hypothetical protein GCM10025732_23490 [Glycomyces mayteni]
MDVGVVAAAAEQLELHVPGLAEQFELRDVLGGVDRGVLGLVRGRVRVRVLLVEGAGLALADVVVELEGEVGVPGAGRVGELGLDRLDVDRGCSANGSMRTTK